MNTHTTQPAKGVTERIHRAVLRRYYTARTLYPIWFYFLNNQGRKLWKANNGKQLSDVQKKAVHSLATEGFAMVHITDLLPKERWQELQEHFSRIIEKPEFKDRIDNPRSAPLDRGDKYFNIELFPKPIIDFENPLIRLSLDETVLDITNAYMEMWVKFSGMRLWATTPVPEGARAHASQNWHRDPEDKKNVKMFLYFGDVDDAAGPLHYVRQSHYKGKWRHIFPQQPPLGSYPPPGEVERAVPPEDIIQCTAPKGTLLFCDTTGLHRGGYCKSRTRLVYQSVYSSKASMEPVNHTVPPALDLNNLSKKVAWALLR